MLRSLKECKRTLRAERKRTQCPTLTNSWQQYCGMRIRSEPELFPGSEYKTKLLVLVWLNLLKNNLLVLKNNPDPGSKGICWNTIISLTQKHIRIQNISPTLLFVNDTDLPKLFISYNFLLLNSFWWIAVSVIHIVADSYHFDTDPDPWSEKICSGSWSRANFDTDPDPGKNDMDPDPAKKG